MEIAQGIHRVEAPLGDRIQFRTAPARLPSFWAKAMPL